MSLTFSPPLQAVPPLSQTDELRHYCRRFAEDRGAGLIEVMTGTEVAGEGFAYIYKRLQIPAFMFYGVVVTPAPAGTWIWMVIAREHGTTGVREAVVAGQLLEAGQLTLEAYESSWAQDPYDPSYRGVDRGTLCYLSDAAKYDSAFPGHPLTKVRYEVKRLLGVRIGPIAA